MAKSGARIMKAKTEREKAVYLAEIAMYFWDCADGGQALSDKDWIDLRRAARAVLRGKK